MKVMKNLILLVITVAFTLGTSQAAVVCKKQGRYWRPVNDKAIKIAKMLNVKTCTGKRFRRVVKKLGETSNVTATSKKMSVDQVVTALK